MTLKFSEFLELFLSYDETSDCLRSLSAQKVNFDLSEQELFRLSTDLQKEFQFTCVDIIKVDESNYPVPMKREQSQKIVDKLSVKISNKFKSEITFKENAAITNKGLADSLIQNVFLPLSEQVKRIRVI